MLKAIPTHGIRRGQHHPAPPFATAPRRRFQPPPTLAAMRLSRAAQIIAEGVHETLAYMAFPREHWSCIHTNNILERGMREIRRPTRVVGNLPDGRIALMLVGARLRHVVGTRWATRPYMDMSRITEQEAEAALSAASA